MTSSFGSKVNSWHTRATIPGALICLLCVLATLAAAAEFKKYGKLYLNLREYQAESADEAAIVSTLIQFERAFNSGNLKKFNSFFTKDALHRLDGTDIWYSIGSSDCQSILTACFGAFQFEIFCDPKISAKDDGAIVELVLETRSCFARYTLSLRAGQQGWQIWKAEYTHERPKG